MVQNKWHTLYIRCIACAKTYQEVCTYVAVKQQLHPGCALSWCGGTTFQCVEKGRSMAHALESRHPNNSPRDKVLVRACGACLKHACLNSWGFVVLSRGILCHLQHPWRFRHAYICAHVDLYSYGVVSIFNIFRTRTSQTLHSKTVLRYVYKTPSFLLNCTYALSAGWSLFFAGSVGYWCDIDI